MRFFPLRPSVFWRHTRNSSQTLPGIIRSSSTAMSVLYVLTVSTSPAKPSPEDASHKSHHVKGGFQNPWDSWRDVSFKIVGQILLRRLTGKANIPDTTPPTVPVRNPEFLLSRDNPKLRATWLGHACYYVEFPSGLRVLFDPVFEERCGPYNLLGPKRYTSAPCQVKDIPMIDAVVISHNHYDHLSHSTVSEIAKKHPNCHFFAPLGNKPWFTDSGIHNMTELDWWDERDITMSPSEHASTQVEAAGEAVSKAAEIKARISCMPSQHVSARGPFDRCKTLWASWAVESDGRKVYFAGDTGYGAVPELPDGEDDHDPKYNFPECPAFKNTGQFRGPFDLGLIPIGAYGPRFIFSPVHADPHDAVKIFQDTKCKKALGMHWGTWVLTEEDVLEPPEKLKAALKKHGIPETGVFDVCDIGESREF